MGHISPMNIEQRMIIAGPRLGGLTKFDTWPGGGCNNGKFSISEESAMARAYFQGQHVQDGLDAEIFSSPSLSENRERGEKFDGSIDFDPTCNDRTFQ